MNPITFNISTPFTIQPLPGYQDFLNDVYDDVDNTYISILSILQREAITGKNEFKAVKCYAEDLIEELEGNFYDEELIIAYHILCCLIKYTYDSDAVALERRWRILPLLRNCFQQITLPLAVHEQSYRLCYELYSEGVNMKYDDISPHQLLQCMVEIVNAKEVSADTQLYLNGLIANYPTKRMRVSLLGRMLVLKHLKPMARDAVYHHLRKKISDGKVPLDVRMEAVAVFPILSEYREVGRKLHAHSILDLTAIVQDGSDAFCVRHAAIRALSDWFFQDRYASVEYKNVVRSVLMHQHQNGKSRRLKSYIQTQFICRENTESSDDTSSEELRVVNVIFAGGNESSTAAT